jgi:glycine hydroxymethyltransferase
MQKDKIEQLAIDRVCKLFDCAYANVQPHSGAQANGAVFLALLQPGDTFLAMGLNAGGHLSHGAKPNISGKWFNAVQYGVDPATGLIDYDQVESLAVENRPRLIIAGGSAYPRQIDFEKFRIIADKVGAYLMVDMAHFAGIVAAGQHPSPFSHAHIVTSTTHKTLRGPRGGIILTNDADLAKKINSAVFPGYQGGPLMHVIAAKAVAFHEALQPSFKEYIRDVCLNVKALSETLTRHGFPSITGGTDTHLICINVSGRGINGHDSAVFLDNLGITCNKNAIPFDPLPPKITSGLRLGSPAVTSRGFKVAEFQLIGDLIGKGLISLSEGAQESVAKEIQHSVKELCDAFSIYA